MADSQMQRYLAVHDAAPLSQATTEVGLESSTSNTTNTDIEAKPIVGEYQYRMFKRRWLGLAQLTVLNLVIGWGGTAPSTVSTTATKWYNVSYETLNWLSISSQFIFLVPAPFALWILNKQGPKFSMLVACFFTVLGNWITYAGATQRNFPMNIAGGVLAAIASPFAITAPTRYSRLWFDDYSRTLATALPSLAYPLGAGVGALSGPYMVKPVGPLNYDQQARIIAILFTVTALPVPFLPKEPPTPPALVAHVERPSMLKSLKSLARNRVFYLQFLNFSIFAGFIDTLAAVVNQAIEPYGFAQVDAGYAIATLIFTGVVAALIISPILDRTKAHKMALKYIVIILAGAITALPFMPGTRSVAGLFVVMGIIGACALSVEPCVLEFQAAWTHPVSPEFSSVVTWCGAKIVSGVLIILVGNVMVLKKPEEGQPAASLFNGLILMAVMSWIGVVDAWLIGHGIFKRPEVSDVAGND